VRTLALDPGERRIGVAITDPTGTLPQPLETIETRGLESPAALERIAEIVEKYGVGRIVIGLALHMDGREGEQARSARSFGARLAQALGVEVEFIDERWSSLEAERSIRASEERGSPRSDGRRARGGHPRARKERARQEKGRVDRVAATLLLGTWLERARR
jgi:putative Holliday junction resolvase